jgi:hypothetical protein
LQVNEEASIKWVAGTETGNTLEAETILACFAAGSFLSKAIAPQGGSVRNDLSRRFAWAAAFVPGALVTWSVLTSAIAFAQNPQVQQRLAAIKESSAQNKQALAQYTWQEQDTISIKGEVKKQESYQVRIGPDGKPQKMPLTSPQPAQSSESGGRHGRLKEKIVENKKEEFKEYADNIGALAHSYAQPDPQLLEQAFQKGNVTIKPGDASNQASLFIANYLKPNDSVAFTFDSASKSLMALQISSYMDSPSDAVTIAIQFSKLPDGTNHISTMNVDGVSKKLVVAVQNSNYQKL